MRLGCFGGQDSACTLRQASMRQCQQATTSKERGQPKRNRTDVLLGLSTLRVTADRWAKLAHLKKKKMGNIQGGGQKFLGHYERHFGSQSTSLKSNSVISGEWSQNLTSLKSDRFISSVWSLNLQSKWVWKQTAKSGESSGYTIGCFADISTEDCAYGYSETSSRSKPLTVTHTHNLKGKVQGF